VILGDINPSYSPDSLDVNLSVTFNDIRTSTYDDAGNRTRLSADFDSDGIGDSWSEFTSDANGNLESKSVVSYGAAWRWECTYDTNGNQLNSTLSDADGTVNRSFTYTYVDSTVGHAYAYITNNGPG
jgi:hypothetical protein